MIYNDFDNLVNRVKCARSGARSQAFRRWFYPRWGCEDFACLVALFDDIILELQRKPLDTHTPPVS
jgi:hypothetical protein